MMSAAVSASNTIQLSVVFCFYLMLMLMEQQAPPFKPPLFLFSLLSLSLSSFSLFSLSLSFFSLLSPGKKSCFTHTMDDDGLNMRNWGYYEPSFKEHNGLQLMSPFGDHRDTKPFLSARETSIMINPHGGAAAGTTTAGAGYHHHPLIPMPYMRDSWVHRERLLHMLPGPGNPTFVPDHSGSGSNSIHIMQPNDSLKDPGMSLEDIGGGDGDGECVGDVGGPNGPVNKRSGPLGPKGPRVKKPKKAKETANQTCQRSKVMKRSLDIVINGLDMDISGIPIPVCSCTGTPQQCYRWGSGGWQSACCTTTISMYPLPMSTKRRGARIAGRKMSQGAFKKVLEKLASEGYSFDNAIDLRAHWAKHGTNKFVTIR